MVLLQPKLSVKLSQRQILTPGLVQMVSVLALNKLELKDMINAEMVENPVLEELEDAIPLLDDVGRQEEERDRIAAQATAEEKPIATDEKKDPFEEIDFGSFFQDYLDPGYRSRGEMEEIEKPSFENFLSKPGNLTDHLLWQLGAISVRPQVHDAVELIVGNLSEDGYLIASDEELLGITPPAAPESDAQTQQKIVGEAQAIGIEALAPSESETPPVAPECDPGDDLLSEVSAAPSALLDEVPAHAEPSVSEENKPLQPVVAAPAAPASFTLSDLHEALEIVRQFDPPGVACRDLRECLLYQLRYHLVQLQQHRNGNGATEEVVRDAMAVVDQHLRAVTLKQFKEIGRAIGRPIEAVQAALQYIRTLDPRPGLQYNKVPPRLIEPDVAFIKHGDEWLVIMNDEDMPQLRLNPAYRRLLSRDGNDRDTRNYVKERYKSAIQLIKNIEQRKQTIMKVCYSIVARQQDFLEKGIDHLLPMMIKEVAEEIGVHPSTVSRAVANKYAHTPQGVFELRYFFSESVQGPEGGNTSLLILKRRVKKLIEEEDPSRPLTDERITRILQSQGIQVTRRTVAKYREDMKIPSTHQRRVKK
ncbi:MAG: RNA polymerase factor sigma-54 [Terriglobales bacterium]